MAKPISFPDSPWAVPDGSAPNIINRGTVATAARWQTWHDSWRNTTRDLRWYGQCVVCERNVWAFDDGENDPRGVLGDNALWPVTPDSAPEGIDPETVEIRCCAICANDYDSYKAAHRIAATRGLDVVAPLAWPGRSR